MGVKWWHWTLLGLGVSLLGKEDDVSLSGNQTLYKKDEQPSLSVLLCQPFLNKITRKALFGRPYVCAIDLIEVEERLYSIGAAMGHALRNKLDILIKLLSIPHAKDDRVNRIMSLCKKDAKKNLGEFTDEFGREPDTFGDLISCRRVENRLRSEGMELSAKEAIEAYVQGNRKIKKIFDEKIDVEGGQLLMMALLQGIHFGSSFPELTEKMYQSAQIDDNDCWEAKWHGLTIPDELKATSLKETQGAVLQIVAAYSSKYYPELQATLDLGRYLYV